MADYKDTLNLPKTSFPMKANLANREPAMLARWEKQNVYQQIRQSRAGKKPFILHDGPPYANGNIHIGHAVNKILKDMVVKSHTLDGFDSPYIPGWDCHGLPIELNVEKKVGKPGNKVTAAEFRTKCREYAEKQVTAQMKDFERLGVFGEWDKPYKTMNFGYEADIIRTMAGVVKNGHLHRGFKPVYWCTDCGSALAEAEVEYHDKTSPAIDVAFGVLDEEALLSRCHRPDGEQLHHGEGDMSLVIWTTTPWTLPANQAVAVHPELDYVVIQVEARSANDADATNNVEDIQTPKRLVVAEALMKDCMSNWGIEHYHVLAYCKGVELEKLKLQHPFYDRVVPVILGEHVTTEAGTGCVHTAPGHGVDDFIVGQRYKLPVENPVGANGVFLADTEEFAGQFVFKANQSIIDRLKATGNLLLHKNIQHSYPHCWRHKMPIIFRATPQWFINMDKEGLRKQAMDAIEQVQWVPDWGQARIESMIENRPDWCISRQRTWGVPLSVFAHKKTGEPHPDSVALMEKVAKQVEQSGIQAWFDLKVEDLLGDEASDYDKVHDTLDVWIDSGVSHHCVLDAREGLERPADLYLEGSDQHRGWFQSSLLTSLAFDGKAPYKAVLTHGFVVDAKGEKMSKSKGNVVSPQEVNNKLGADVLRLWVASTDYQGEMAISDEILNRTADTYRRIRNTARFLISNINEFDAESHAVPFEKMLPLDQWAVAQAQEIQEQIKTGYENYDFLGVVQKLHHFCSISMGGFYLDIIKDRQYTAKTGTVAHRSCQTAMHLILEAMVRWITPVLSFTADELWQLLPNRAEPTPFTEYWYQGLQSLPDDAKFSMEDWQQILEIKNAVNKALEEARKEGTIGGSLEAEVTLYCQPQLQTLLSQLGDELRFILIISKAEIVDFDQKPDALESSDLEGLVVVVAKVDAVKCARCWHRREDVGANKAHPEICLRCVDNVDGAGEVRQVG